MTRYATCLQIVLSLVIVLMGVSASQAGLFGRWRPRYDSAVYPPAVVPTPPAPSVPAAGQPTASKAGPLVYTAAMPVVGENGGTRLPASLRNGAYVPAPPAYSGSGWSTLPRSSWDFGKFPPYSN